MDEIARLRLRCGLAPGTPADITSAGEDEGDRFLVSVMVQAGLRSRLDFEQSAPDGRINSLCRRDRSVALRTWCLRGPQVELIRPDDMDRGCCAHSIRPSLEFDTWEVRRVQDEPRLNFRLRSSLWMERQNGSLECPNSEYDAGFETWSIGRFWPAVTRE